MKNIQNNQTEIQLDKGGESVPEVIKRILCRIKRIERISI